MNKCKYLEVFSKKCEQVRRAGIPLEFRHEGGRYAIYKNNNLAGFFTYDEHGRKCVLQYIQDVYDERCKFLEEWWDDNHKRLRLTIVGMPHITIYKALVKETATGQKRVVCSSREDAIKEAIERYGRK